MKVLSALCLATASALITGTSSRLSSLDRDRCRDDCTFSEQRDDVRRFYGRLFDIDGYMRRNSNVRLSTSDAEMVCDMINLDRVVRSNLKCGQDISSDKLSENELRTICVDYLVGRGSF